MSVFVKKFGAFVVFGVLFTLANYTVTVHRDNVRLKGMCEIAEMRADVNTEMADELLWSRVNDVYKLTEEQLVSQGRVEGVVSYLSGDNREVFDNLWHEGYMRGLTQVDYEYDVISESNYERGYHQAMQDAFPEHPVKSFGFVNEPPRNVSPDAIKTPEFDFKNEDLFDTEKVIDDLNKKIEEVDPRNKTIKSTTNDE